MPSNISLEPTKYSKLYFAAHLEHWASRFTGYLLMRLILILWCVFCSSAFAQPLGNCEGSPAEAITQLPPPLSSWGQVECTPYGHVISAHEGWVWSYPGAFAPVFIPSQMVRRNPEPLGNNSYFKTITLSKVTAEEGRPATAALGSGLDLGQSMPTIYRLRVVSVSGKELTIFLFDYPDEKHKWGVWCNETCEASSRFMLLDMSAKK